MIVDGWNKDPEERGKDIERPASAEADGVVPGRAGSTIPRIFLYRSRMIEQVVEWTWKKSGEKGCDEAGAYQLVTVCKAVGQAHEVDVH